MALPSFYNQRVEIANFEEMKCYVGFNDADAANVASLARYIRPSIPQIVEHFYEVLLRSPSAKVVFTGGEVQLTRQRQMLTMWLTELFDGKYDNDYYDRRLRIGTAHVRVGLPQQFMCLGMEITWQEVRRIIKDAKLRDADDKLDSLHKLLTLDLATMLETYKEAYSEKIRADERTAVEERLTRAEHLAEIGQLAASLAHEIKNPLAGISGAIQVFRDDLAPDDPRQSTITEILGQIHRLDAAVIDLLLYARPTPPRAADVSLADTIRRVLNVLAEEPALQHVEVEFDHHAKDIHIHADRGQIEQLLINLLINAAHASHDGGAIRVNVTHLPDRIRLVVADSGKGMSPEVQSRAFEPFFTTKAKGTGLGLSICRRIVETHGGRVFLESAIGRGTTVVVDFPQPPAIPLAKASP
jgi:signal transduction histidine kinase